MWGDPARAVRLDGSDPLVSLLFQVTGPAHVPWTDPVWQELLYGYSVWVHCTLECSPVLQRAAQFTVAYCARTSNLAALTLHVTRSLEDLIATLQNSKINYSTNYSTTGNLQSHVWEQTIPVSSQNYQNHSSIEHHEQQQQVTAFSHRISLVGKARATAGALNLLRLLIHAVIAELYESQQHQITDQSTSSRHQNRRNTMTSSNSFSTLRPRTMLPSVSSSSSISSHHTFTDKLEEIFCYKSRESNTIHDTGANLVTALLGFLCHGDSLNSSHDIPELYDCSTMVLQLVLVLLSTQLYQPLQSSFQRQLEQQQQPPVNDYFFRILMQQSNQISDVKKNGNNSNHVRLWSPRQLLTMLLDWHIHRPLAPEKSIQYHACNLTQQVVTAKGERRSADGLYESHLIVQASAPSKRSNNSIVASDENADRLVSIHSTPSPQSAILDATRGALLFSSQIILLPFRLMTLALQLWGQNNTTSLHGKNKEWLYDQSLKQLLQRTKKDRGRTRDVLWLTQSPLADLSDCLLLLLSNTERFNPHNDICCNLFRDELRGMRDNRWDTSAFKLPDLPSDYNSNDTCTETVTLLESSSRATNQQSASSNSGNDAPIHQEHDFAINFEGLFHSFGNTAHTEAGALLLYTLLQASPTFATYLAVRSDLDKLVLPLLRTMYFATAMHHFIAHDKNTTNSNISTVQRPSSDNSVSSVTHLIHNLPYRSISHLYVLIILLLLFSQDSSFGADAFRRVMVNTVPWYKERYLKEINLGSVLVLILTRCLTFTLTRQNDAFLLSNCCAVLMNLSASMVHVHEYAAMRLTTLTVSSMKRYLQLCQENPDNNEDDLTTPTSMYAEASRTLLCTIKHCVSTENLSSNLHVVYALLYYQADFQRLWSPTNAKKGVKNQSLSVSQLSTGPFKRSEIHRIQTVIAAGARTLEEHGGARTAPKALEILTQQVNDLIEAVASDDRRKGHSLGSTQQMAEDFTFTYEEEADPEIFFVPYVWEVVVCVVTAATIEWNRNRIQVFPLLEMEEEDNDDGENNIAEMELQQYNGSDFIPQFARDVNDVV